MRDYTGVKYGAFCALHARQFGEGHATKDWVKLAGDVYIIKGDTKKEVIRRLGVPDRMCLDDAQIQAWQYSVKRITIFFINDRVSSWQRDEIF